MLERKAMAEVSRQASALIGQARDAYRVWNAMCEGADAPADGPYLADSDSVAFYADAQTAAAAAADEDVEPIFFDINYHKRKKHNRWVTVEAPQVAPRYPLVDSHAHVHMLPQPGLAMARAGAASMQFLGLVTDPSEDGTVVFDQLERWNMEAALLVRSLAPNC